MLWCYTITSWLKQVSKKSWADCKVSFTKNLWAQRDTWSWSQLWNLHTSSFHRSNWHPIPTPCGVWACQTRAEKPKQDPLGASRSNQDGQGPNRPTDLSWCLDCCPVSSVGNTLEGCMSRVQRGLSQSPFALHGSPFPFSSISLHSFTNNKRQATWS